MSIKTKYQILFDYDGVLTRKVDFAEEVGKKYNIPTNKIRTFFNNHLESCLKGQSDLKAALLDNLQNIGWKGTAEGLFNALYFETLFYNKELLEYIESKIKTSSKIHIATNQEHHRHERIEKDTLLKPHLGNVFSSCKLGVSKPSTEYFEKVHRLLEKENGIIPKNNILFIDDLIVNIESAEQYGIQAHLFKKTGDFIRYYENIVSGNSFPTVISGALSLTKMKFSHSKGYSDILSDALTHRFITDSGPINQDQAKEKILSNRRSYDHGRSIYWSIEGEGGLFLGYLAIHNYLDSKVSISYGIHPRHRRKGIATQCLSTILKWAGVTGKKVEMATHKENQASFHMLSKMDLRYTGFRMTNFGERHVYCQDRSDT